MSHNEESDNGDDYAQNSKGKTESKGGHYPRRFFAGITRRRRSDGTVSGRTPNDRVNRRS
jgi:hypothetical protein